MLFVGDNMTCGMTAPLAHSMRTAIIRPHGLVPGETLPDGALLIQHVDELPALLWAM